MCLIVGCFTEYCPNLTKDRKLRCTNISDKNNAKNQTLPKECLFFGAWRGENYLANEVMLELAIGTRNIEREVIPAFGTPETQNKRFPKLSELPKRRT